MKKIKAMDMVYLMVVGQCNIVGVLMYYGIITPLLAAYLCVGMSLDIILLGVGFDIKNRILTKRSNSNTNTSSEVLVFQSPKEPSPNILSFPQPNFNQNEEVIPKRIIG